MLLSSAKLEFDEPKFSTTQEKQQKGDSQGFSPSSGCFRGQIVSFSDNPWGDCFWKYFPSLLNSLLAFKYLFKAQEVEAQNGFSCKRPTIF